VLRPDYDDGTVTIHSGGASLVRYRAVTAASKPHVDRLALGPDAGGAAGRNLLLAGPHDHPWHLGGFFAPKFVDGINCWESESRRAAGEECGRAVDRGHDVSRRGETATIRQSVAWRTDEESLLGDERTITVSTAPERGYVLGWEQTVEALETARRIEGSDPDGGRGSYGGFSLRFDRGLADGEVRLPDADDPPDRSGPTGGYCDYTGPIDGRRGSVDPWHGGCTLLLDAAPDGRSRRQRWFVAREYPFVGTNPTWDSPIEIDPGERRRWRWGVWVRGGRPDRSEIERVRDRFLADD